MAATRRGRALTLGHQQQLNLLRDQQAQRLGTLWSTVGNISDDTEFIRLAEPIVRSGRVATGRLTTAYLNGYQVLEAGGSQFVVMSPEQLDEIASGIRNSAAIDELLHRPTVAARTTLSNGGLWVDAMAAGRSQVETIARTDVSLVERATMGFLARRLSPRGWMRIAESRPCSFCARASGQIVSKPNINPIHPNCHCTLEPIYSDSTRQIAAPAVKATDDYGFEVGNHGEYGPTPVRQYESQE